MVSQVRFFRFLGLGVEFDFVLGLGLPGFFFFDLGFSEEPFVCFGLPLDDFFFELD